MTESVKPRRRYQSPRRAAQAAQTRRDIVTAAGLLFRERGYGVPLADIASEAGVVVETVYRIFGTQGRAVRGSGRGAARGWRRPGRGPGRGAAGDPGHSRRAGSAQAGGGLCRDAARDPPPCGSAPARPPRRQGERSRTAAAVGRDGGLAARRTGALRADARRPGGAQAGPRRSTSGSTSRGRCARLPSTTCWSSIGAGATSGIRRG